MIADHQTNFLYLADSLPRKYPDIFKRLVKTLEEFQVKYDLLPNTNDIWARDYMPIQVAKDKFVQFDYNPDYLQFKKYIKTISDVDSICQAINIKPQKSPIKLDGGNVIRSVNKVILCDKVFRENPAIPEKQLIKELYNLFEVEQLIFIPTQPNDFTGHADGLVRFLDSETVLINDLSKEKPEFARSFRLALHNARLKYIEFPYNPYSNKSNKDAKGCYLNYLQIANNLIFPLFHIKEDEMAMRMLFDLFSDYKWSTFNCNDIAAEGGILNCISWNIVIEQCYHQNG